LVAARSISARIWLCFALSLFLLQVLPYLSHRWVTDESWYAAPAYSIAHGTGVRGPEIGPNDLEHTFDARPPGTFLVMAAFFKVFGTGQIAARMGSVLAGIGIVLLVFKLTEDVLGKEGAILAAFLAASDNLIVLVSKTARPEALTVMLILAALLAIQRYAGTGRRAWCVWGGLLMAAGTMFHITLLGFLISIGALAVAIDRRKGAFPLRGAIPYAIAYGSGLLPFALWVMSDPVRREGFREEYLARAKGGTLIGRLIAESHRYNDLLGIGILHGHGLEHLPLRLPIPLFFLCSTWVLWRYRRSWFYLELLLILPTMLWLVETVNRSSRYLSLLAPILSIVIAAAVISVRERPRFHRAMFAGAMVIVVAQASANVVLLRGFKGANYDRVGRELRSMIPQGQTTYGTITFWLALRDSPYIAYERTTPGMAADKFQARYFIAGDPMMRSGLASEPRFYRELQVQMAEIEERSDLVGEIQDSYYGDLKVYRLRR
jgi:4-amino-4-deoxy-L-arabinose transferase-like glycosyltransferase